MGCLDAAVVVGLVILARGAPVMFLAADVDAMAKVDCAMFFAVTGLLVVDLISPEVRCVIGLPIKGLDAPAV